jgi:tetratricopeptide (TPR) repeat protein
MHATQDWLRPDFRKMFSNTFTFDAETEPEISRENRDFLKELQLLFENQLDTAIEQLESRITGHPDPALLYYLGGFYLRENNPRQAQLSFEKAIEKFPNFRRAWLNLGISYLEQENYHDAVEAAGNALRYGSNNTEVYGMLGYSHLNLGSYQAAITAYENATMLDGDNPQWLQGIAQCLFELGRYKDALSVIEQLLKGNANPQPLLVLKARTLQNLGDGPKAIVTLEQAALYQPLEADDLLNLADLYLRENTFEPATRTYQILLTHSDFHADPQEMAKRLGILIDHQQWNLASEIIPAIRNAFREDSSTSLQFDILEARVQIASGNAKDGVHLMQTVLEEHPMQTGVALLLADYFLSEKQYDDAERYYQRASAQPEDKLNAALGLAKVQLTQQNYSRALYYLETANRIEPGEKLEAYIRTLRAYVYPDHEKPTR